MHQHIRGFDEAPGTAVRDRDLDRDHGHASSTSTIANVSGTAREKSRRTIRDFFPKPESDFAALGRRRAVPFGRTMSVIATRK
jgi:hypothetical protein